MVTDSCWCVRYSKALLMELYAKSASRVLPREGERGFFPGVCCYVLMDLVWIQARFASFVGGNRTGWKRETWRGRRRPSLLLVHCMRYIGCCLFTVQDMYVAKNPRFVFVMHFALPVNRRKPNSKERLRCRRCAALACTTVCVYSVRMRVLMSRAI